MGCVLQKKKVQKVEMDVETRTHNHIKEGCDETLRIDYEIEGETVRTKPVFVPVLFNHNQHASADKNRFRRPLLEGERRQHRFDSAEHHLSASTRPPETLGRKVHVETPFVDRSQKSLQAMMDVHIHTK